MKQKLLLVPVILMLLTSFTPPGSTQVKVDATKTLGKLEPFWASQIIHPTEFLLTGWGKDFVNLLSESGAARQFIRVYNQPETAIRVAPDGKISYDWIRFDEMADIILSTGNKVKVVFFGMPYELAAFPESVKKRPYGGLVCISPPRDYKQWEELCADFTSHVIRKYGLKEVSQWTFRCWNEPDHNGFWHKADQQEYLKLYDHFAKAVKGISNDIKIGGPALTSTGTYRKPENFKFFLEHVSNGVNHATGEVGSPIDYLGIHTYGGSGAGGGPGRDYPEVDYIIEQHHMYADMRDQYPKLRNIPIHVEEWGISSGGTTGVKAKPSADVRNSQYGAAFLATMVGRHIQMRQEKDRRIEAFTFCSSGYETIPSQDFMGYRTFHTKHGFHKPILNAYKMLNLLASDMVPVTLSPANKHITAFATRDAKRITVIVANYQHDRISNDGASYPVTLNIDPQWKPGTEVTLNHWRIDENHSNAYTVFKEIGSPELPNPLEIDAVKKRMHLEMLERPKQLIAKDLANIQFELPCNGVSLIEIVRR